MSIIKQQIKYLIIPTGTTQINVSEHTSTGITGIVNIKFNLSSEDNFLGYQQEIDNLTQNVSDTLINPDIDLEERRFKYVTHSPAIQLNFKFSSTPTSSFLLAGFTYSELEQKQPSALNSFFIFDLYDTYDANTQIKILRTYITKIGILPQYTLDSNNQIYNLYVPLAYMDVENVSSITGYTKMSFYNAKTGKIILFYNPTYILTPRSPQFLYFPTKLNVIQKTWEFLPASTTIFNANEMWQSPQYSQRVNNTFSNFNNEAQDYPSGSTFNYQTGKYVTV